MFKTSVCIPVYISSELELDYLKQNLSRLKVQKFAQVELIVSDATTNQNWSDQVKAMTIEFENSKYVTAKGFNIGRNVNSAVTSATNDLVKLIFQDDFMINNCALLFSNVRLSLSRRTWYVSACNHYSEIKQEFYGYHRPKLSSTLLAGGNTLSSPSVVTFRRKSFVQLSDSLTYLVDCDWYLRMSHQNGPPILGIIPLISNRIHISQATNWAKSLLESEKSTISKMHSCGDMKLSECICLQIK